MKILDMHFDLSFDLVRQTEIDLKTYLNEHYLNNFKRGNIFCLICAIYIDHDYLDQAYLRSLDHIKALKSAIHNNSNFLLCLTYEDIVTAQEGGKIGILLALEGIEPFEGQLSRVKEFYDLGIRVLSLTWSRSNDAAYGASYGSQHHEKGLSEFGKAIIRKMNELNIVLDVSHLNEKGFWQVIDLYKYPIIASHSNSKALHPINRNLSDQQITAIAKNNGVIGLNATSALLNKPADVSTYVDHLDYMKGLVGLSHLGFGFDLCNHIIPYLDQTTLDTLPEEPYDIIENHAKTNDIIEALLSQGYSLADIEKIAYKNTMRVLKTILSKGVNNES